MAVEHAVLSDGWQRIRLDVTHGSLAAGHPVHLHYLLNGTVSAEARLWPLRRLLHFHRHRVFDPALYPHNRSIAYALTVLRVHDATVAGASHRDIARALFGNNVVACDWNSSSDFLRSRVRRFVANARRMNSGAFKTLLTKDYPAEALR
ncbi:DNA -binding domain-containing protein [Sphingomonas paeninsulae]